jgi:hypothetical protein
MRLRLPGFVCGFVFVGLVLTSDSSQITPLQPVPEKAKIPAETIAYTGHGMLFDAEMKQIKLDSPLVAEIQDSMIDDILNASAGALPEATASKIQHARELLHSQELNADETVMVKSGIIEHLLQGAPEELTSKYRWRNQALASRYLDYMDRNFERNPELSARLRPEILELLPQIGPAAVGDTAYMADCRARGVPIPPPWAESGTAWQLQGTLTQNLLAPGDFAAVWTYSDPSVRGACIALPRGSGSFGSAAGIICQSATTGHACFWDNKLKTDPAQQFIGWRGLRLVISDLRDGSDLNENCTGCHRGNNVFLISPDDPTWAKLMRGPLSGPLTGTFTTQVETSSDNQGGHPRYIPVSTTPPRPGWTNPFAAGGCAGACHELPPNFIVQQANLIGLLMPPNCALPSTTDPTGCYTPRPRISRPMSISFGSVPQKDIRTRIMRISNVGSANLSVSIPASPPPPPGQPRSGFFWSAFADVIPPGQGRDVVVEFTPRAEGPFIRSLSVASNDLASPHSVRLSGRGLPLRGENGGPIHPQ